MEPWINTFAFVVTLAGALTFFHARLKTYLHLFQQDEYDGLRFLGWVISTFTVDKRLSITLIAILTLGSQIEPKPDYAFAVVVGFVFFAFGLTEKNPEKTAKKKLAMTARASRIYWLGFAVLAAPTMVLCLVLDWRAWPYFGLVFLVQLVPFALVLANALLTPLEHKVQRTFWQEAHDKLAKLSPTVIGITGSFGKTSVKHILGHILALHAPTLITPGSVNTPMGIARVVREKLDGQHRYFIAEMGAYGLGSINRLCELAPPDLGIVTAIGNAHFERFKSLEQVTEAKFELGEWVAKRSGKLFFPEHLLQFARVAAFNKEHPNSSVPLIARLAESKAALGPSGVKLVSAEQTKEGLKVVLDEGGQEHVCFCPLFGMQQVGNIVLAFAAARALDVSAEAVLVALKSVPQIAHRLEVKPQNGWTLIDDAYNANPQGMMAGMKLLDLLVEPGGKRILLTPGLVELGARHDLEHERIGEASVNHADILVVINPERVKTLIKGRRAEMKRLTESSGDEEKMLTFQSFKEANVWLLANVKAGDAVLIANDLPDLYESRPRL